MLNRPHRAIAGRAMAAMPVAALAGALFVAPASALDLNSFRAQHKLPPLSYSATLSAAAQEHARDMAKRNHLDHKGFKQRIVAITGGAAAENVSMTACRPPPPNPLSLFIARRDCCDEDCVIRRWAKSPGHRRNMLMTGVSAYGLASAVSDSGRKYWVLELGN